MTVKLLHTADWQIGKGFANFEGDAGALLRTQRLKTVERIARIANEQQADVLKDAEIVLDAANKTLQAIDQRLERQRLTAEKDRLTTAFNASKAADDKAREARAASSAIKVDATGLKRLRSLDQKRSEAEGALAGSSTLIQFQLEVENSVMVGGKAAPLSGDMSVADPTKLDIAGAGTIIVIPGGEELSTKRTNAENARKHLHDALQKLGCGSLVEADALLQERQAHDAAVSKHVEVLQIHAPEGIEKLSEQLSAAVALIAKLPEATEDVGLDRATVQSSQREADQQVKIARTQRDTCQSELGEAKQELARQRAFSSSAADKARDTAAELERARLTKTDVMLREELATATEQVTRAKAVLEQTQQVLAEADPEVARLSFESARDGHKAIRDEMEKLKATVERLALELQFLGQQGLGETLQDLEGRRNLGGCDRAAKHLLRQILATNLAQPRQIITDRRPIHDERKVASPPLAYRRQFRR